MPRNCHSNCDLAEKTVSPPSAIQRKFGRTHKPFRVKLRKILAHNRRRTSRNHPVERLRYAKAVPVEPELAHSESDHVASRQLKSIEIRLAASEQAGH